MAEKDTNKDRVIIIRGFFIIIALALIFKSFQLQVIDKTYAQLAQSVVISDMTIYPSRGLILDRKDRLLVTNKAMYDLMVVYNLVGEMDTLKFCKLLNITLDEFNENLNKDFNNDRFDKRVPFAFLKKIPAEECAKFQESLYEFPGFFLQIRNIRSYPYNAGAHVLGYINEVNQKQIDNSEGVYSRGDYVGVKGLEAQYEEELRGQKGSKKAMKDNFGRIEGSWLGGEQDILPVSGKDIKTGLDIELQVYAEKLMGNKRGGVVVIEPKSGEILAMLSTPTYNPNLLSINKDRGKIVAALDSDTLKPFFDRAIMAEYPPGSIFKSITSAIGLQSGIWDENRGVSCKGGYDYGGSRPLGCHAHVYPSNIAMALQHSCNSYYCQLFRDMVDRYGYRNPQAGLDSLVSSIQRFGLGRPLGVDLPGEKSGLIPTAAFYDKMYPKNKGSWKSPTVISLAIGQGENQLTTLQMANVAATIANKGWYVQPHLATDIINHEDSIATMLRYPKFHTGIDKQHFDVIHDGMELAVTSGTARMAAVPSFILCGKTGTSENVGTDHSVFFCFAPKEDPQIAIAVFIENAGFGGSYAAPIASLLAEYYLNGGIDPSRQWIEDRMLNANLLQAK